MFVNRRYPTGIVLTVHRMALVVGAAVAFPLTIDTAAAGCNSGNGAATDLLSSANCQSSAAGGSALAVGDGAVADEQFTTSIGSGAGSNGTTGDRNTWIGAGSGEMVTGTHNTAVGFSSALNVNGSSNSAFGDLAGGSVFGNNNAAFGASSGSTVIGSDNTTSGHLSGRSVRGDGNSAFGLGAGQQVTGDNNVAIGAFAGDGVTASDTISIGSNSLAAANSAVAVGNAAQASGVNAAAFGQGSSASGASSLALGNSALASADGAVAVGGNSRATGTNAIAIGQGAVATGSVALGTRASAANGGGAFGDFSSATGVNSTAAGPNATAAFANSTAIGNGARTTRANQQVFGTSSNSYTMPGIASSRSKSSQGTPTHIVTSNSKGDLAAYTPSQLGLAASGDVAGLQSDIDKLGRRDKELTEGLAAVASLAQPIILPGQTFAMRAGWGGYDDASAVSFTMAGVVAENLLRPGFGTMVVDGGVGVGTNNGEVAGRAGLTVGW